MNKIQNTKQFDLEERTLKFAQNIIAYVKEPPKTLANSEVAKQLIRSVGSVGANYIEANESLSKKDFVMRIKICRKEAKESRYWLNLLETPNEVLRNKFIQEATELMKIFGSILVKMK